MTDMLEVLDRIAAGEDERTEFKLLLDNKEKIATEIVAFANARGGWMLFGVDDTGSVQGIADPAALERDLTNLCRQNCIPALQPTIEIIEVEGQPLVLMKIVGLDKPYKSNRGIYYLRVGTTKREATQAELARIFQLRGKVHYDETPVVGTTLDDLNLIVFSRYYRDQFEEPLDEADISLPALLRNMRLAIELSGRLHLTLAGLLLFGEDPQAHLLYTRLSAVRFDGVEMGERMLDRRELRGTLPEIIDGAEAFLRNNVRIAAEITGFRRQDRPQYSHFALREAVVNAVAHRDYSISGSQIRLFIFDNWVEVYSPGRLPNIVTLENVRYGAHYERNSRLCTVLTHLGFMSDIGTGIPRMIRLTKQLSGREPEFELRGEEFIVRIPSAF
jgi:ATP-dependent DNA helicase RecG